VVSPDELVNDEDYEEIFEDMKEECAKYGSLIKVVIPRPDPSGAPRQGVGKVSSRLRTLLLKKLDLFQDGLHMIGIQASCLDSC
jgi:hypothetical protein